MFGPPGLFYRGKQFGTKIVKKSKPCIEAGQRLRPEAQSDDVYVVIGIFVSPKRSRRTEIEILLLKERGSAEFRLMHYDLIAKNFDQPDRFGLETTLSSVEESIIGRELASSLEKSSASIDSFTETDVVGSVPRSCNKKVFLSFESAIHNCIHQKRCKITSDSKNKKPNLARRTVNRRSRDGTGPVDPRPISPVDSPEIVKFSKRRAGRQPTAVANTTISHPVTDVPPASKTPTRTPPNISRPPAQQASDDATNKKFQELFKLMADLGSKIDHVSKLATTVTFFDFTKFNAFDVCSRKYLQVCKKPRKKLSLE